jgi:hypothetical protein
MTSVNCMNKREEKYSHYKAQICAEGKRKCFENLRDLLDA